jgi:hypothetical protein
MLNTRRLCTGAILLLALVAGCSKSVAPMRPQGVADPTDGAVAQDASHPDFLVRLRFVGTTVSLDRNFEPGNERKQDYFVYSSGTLPANPDTVPANATLKEIFWRRTPGTGAGQDPDVYVLDDPLHERRGQAGDGLPFPPGSIILNLHAPDRLGGGVVSVLFHVNFDPDMWWSGPDPAAFPPASDGDGRAVDVQSWTGFRTSPAWPPDGRGYFGPDSLAFLPRSRRPVADDFDRRTFYEIYGDRIYARSENDTVHLGGWVVFATGGYDPDSPYAVASSPTAPTLPPGFASRPDLYPVLDATGLQGSPSGFRLRVQTVVNGVVTQPSETTTYPSFDVASVFYYPVLAGYWRVDLAGKCYAVAMPVDGNGAVGRTEEDLIQLADRVDAGGGTSTDRILRRRVLTFFVR